MFKVPDQSTEIAVLHEHVKSIKKIYTCVTNIRFLRNVRH